MLTRRIGWAGVLAALTVLTACSSNDNSSTTYTSSAANAAKLTIGIEFSNPGLGYKDGSSYSGFDVDTARYVANQLGVPEQNITWKEVDPSTRESLLESGGVDMVVATYSITDDRMKVVDFAGPYFLAHQAMMVRRNDTEVTGPDTLDKKVLCTSKGSTSAQNITTKYKSSNINLKQYDNEADCVDALDKGDVDAVTTDDVILAGFASQGRYRGVLKLIGARFSDERYGIGLKKGSSMLATVNAALSKYISDGAWKKSLDQNVGPSGYSIPSAPKPGTA